MEGGNLNGISLESPLDISTSDMLVPVAAPTFQHNWQKFQGKFLPNSLRFEKNGWAAGWNVFNFNYNDVRVNFADISVGRTKLNDNPSYFINVYKDKDSYSVLRSYVMTTESKLLSSNATMEGNVITGDLAGKPFVITWDPETETASINDQDTFEFTQVQNNDMTWALHITDKTTSYSIDANLYRPSKLECNDMILEPSYTGYSNGAHKWESYNFDGKKVSTPEEVTVTKFKVSGNSLSFDYEVKRQETLSIGINTEEYCYSFDDVTVTTNDVAYEDDSFAIYSGADTSLDFNLFSCTTDKDKLIHTDKTGIKIDMTVPVWFSAKLNYKQDEHTLGAYWPNNVKYGNVKVTTNSVCKATSVFDNIAVTTSASQAATSLNMNWRYNLIEVSNSIGIDSSTFNTRKYIISDKLLYLEGLDRLADTFYIDGWNAYVIDDGLYYKHIWKFKTNANGIGQRDAYSQKIGFTSSTLIADFIDSNGRPVPFSKRKAVGQSYNSKALACYMGLCDVSDFIDYNDYIVPSDPSSMIYNDSGDLGRYCSIKKKGASNSKVRIDEKAYAAQLLSKENILDHIINLEVPDYRVYKADQDPVPAELWTKLYKDGSVTSGEKTWYATYEKVPVHLDLDENFWPFRYVPKCNVKYSGVEYGVYHVDEFTAHGASDEDDGGSYTDYEPITDFDEFVERFGPGSFLNDAQYKRQCDKYINDFGTDREYDDEDNLIGEELNNYGKLMQYCLDSSNFVNGSTVLTPNSRYNVQRIVNRYTYGYDFDYYDINNNSARKEEFEAAWQEVYPNVTCPIHLPQGATSDTTYLNWTNIKVNYSVAPTVNFSNPGYVLYDSGSASWSLDLFNPFKVVPWRKDDSGGVSMKAYQNSKDFTDHYKFETCQEAGYVYIPALEGGASWTNKMELLTPLWGYFGGKIVTQDIDRSQIITLCSNGNVSWHQCIVYPGSHNIIMRSKDRDCWIKQLGVWFRDSESGYNANIYTYTETVTERGKVLVQKSVDYADFMVEQGVQRIGKTYTVKETSGSCVVSQALKGHVAARLRYNGIYSNTDVQGSVDKCFTFTKLPDSECVKDGRIYLDRDTITHSVNWFKFNLSSVVLDTTTGLGSYAMFELKSIAGVDLYYSVPTYNKDGDQVTYDTYYPTCIDKKGHMQYANSSLCALRLSWVPTILYVPVSVDFDLAQIYNKPNHKLYSDLVDMFKDTEAILKGVDGIDFDTFLTDIDLYVGSSKYYKVTVTYNVLDKQWSFKGLTFTANNADVKINSITDKTDEERQSVAVDITCRFNNVSGKFAMVTGDTLIGWSNDKFTCGNGSFEYAYLMQNNSIQGKSSQVTYIDDNDSDMRNIKAVVDISTDIFAVLKNIEGKVFKFNYNDKDYEVDIDVFNKVTALDVLSTDIRRPNTTDIIGSINQEDEFQLVKQQWNTTTAIENYWWVDDDYVLELTSSKFILRRKTDGLDDWNGDNFKSVYEINRSDILDKVIQDEKNSASKSSTCLRYEVTNTYNTTQHGLLLTYYVESDTLIKCVIRDPLLNLREIGSVYFNILNKSIGQKLIDKAYQGNTAILNTYSAIDAYQLLMQAQWSNTVTDGRLFIGCHLSNNFDQWTSVFIISGNFSCEKCIQGYGFVGLKGDLTGGMIPVDYFDRNSGFKDTVEDISVLAKEADIDSVDSAYIVKDTSRLNTITKKVVGSAEKQWYICKELYGVVSHLKYTKGGAFSVESLPITNKYDSVYKSPSFAVTTYGDLMVDVFALESAFDFNGGKKVIWKTLVIAAGYPFLFLYNPRCATLAYLQQTFGQYAYVHYNSSDRPEKKSPESVKQTGFSLVDTQNNSDTYDTSKSILADEFTFDKQIIEQVVDNSPSSRSSFFEALCGTFLNELAHIDREIKVNMETNQTAISDTGKKYGQFAMENLAGITLKSLMTESQQSQALTSKIVGIKSLDMFYSTSDKQRVFAGPGFVEHQFVADCVAQSVTDTSAEGKVQQVSFVLTAVTTFLLRVEIKGMQLLASLSDQKGDATKGTLGCGTSFGVIAAIALYTASYAAKLALVVMEIAQDVVKELLESLGRKNISITTVNSVSDSALNMEAKHKYGEKSETFMWPCWGVPSKRNSYTDETVNAGIIESHWTVAMPAAVTFTSKSKLNNFSTRTKFTRPSSATPTEKDSAVDRDNPYYNVNGSVPYYQAACYGTKVTRTLPSDMACIQGVSDFLSKQSFKNENIGMSEPAFSPSMFQDYKIDDTWNLSQCCTYGRQQWITVKDTKVTNCPPSNMRVSSTFCGIATPYSAVEVKRGLSKAYMRPYAISPNVLALNCTGLNCIYENKLYHAFDGISYRVVEWTGAPGLNKQRQVFLYSFQVNDRFKRSNKFPANELLGNFVSEPVMSIKSFDKVWTKVTDAANEKGLEGGTIGEDKDATRWAIPVFTEPVTTLPAAVKTLTAMPLNVFDGITALTTNLANNQTAYKAPLSIDFTIGKNVYRQTEEYICSVNTQGAVDVVTDIIPSLGLTFIGSTPTEAYFYSQATRHYYMFTGSNLTKMDMMERFRSVQKGYWDFVNQEVVMPCLMTFKRLNAEIEDKDTETDNIIVPVLSKGDVKGELTPPLTTIFNDRSWYKCVSLPSGFAYQGPNRVIINRHVFTEYMLDSLKENIGKWDRMSREKYTTKRGYKEQYSDIVTDVSGVEGWTYNPFMLVTSPVGQDEDTDCLFEWVITFCWPIEMDLIYGVDNYAVVNITAETMTPGGKVKSRPTHVFLTKELFTRNGNYGYYSFRFQSKNGAGNRERLHIWSDQYIAISKLDCEVKPITTRRTEQLTQQLDVQKLKEL